jgi:hypothetical protein
MLQPPRLLFGSAPLNVKNGGWNLQDVTRFHSYGQPVRELYAIVLTKEVDGTGPKALFKEFQKYGMANSDLKFEKVSCTRVPTVDSSSSEYRRHCTDLLNDAYQYLIDNKSDEAVIPAILVILPSKDASLYAEVKWWGDCVKGVPTICITKQKIQKASTDRGGLLANVW